ncbi:hypothetical protein BUALT_Bualt05G0054600 [Buddleja alternifolia]|uniref:Retrotransposon gag domain-containing protein n=1 Tax=Buddleja alternifolia TaxID=168488 RepID=A0AAV6XSQ7_9LAMI|nr:hypothetical protein BUALT_Bualt05G0054600 [Buddleja alternifolia]
MGLEMDHLKKQWKEDLNLKISMGLLRGNPDIICPPNVPLLNPYIQWRGPARLDIQVYIKARLTRDLPSWDTYVRALNDRFGTQLYENPMSELMNLRQMGSVKEYLDQFDELPNHVDLYETYVISYFLVGLKSDIAIQVSMFNAKSLQDAISLAKLQEHAPLLTKRGNNFPITAARPPLPNHKPPLLPTPKPYNSTNSSGPYSTSNSKPKFSTSLNPKPPSRSSRRLTPQ